MVGIQNSDSGDSNTGETFEFVIQTNFILNSGHKRRIVNCSSVSVSANLSKIIMASAIHGRARVQSQQQLCRHQRRAAQQQQQQYQQQQQRRRRRRRSD